MNIDNEEYLTPEWLEAHGFIKITRELEAWEWYPSNLHCRIDDNTVAYVEKEFDRRRFVVIMTPQEFLGGEKGFYMEIFVQEDAGCEYISIPNGFAEWPIYNFCLLYEAIRCKKL